MSGYTPCDDLFRSHTTRLVTKRDSSTFLRSEHLWCKQCGMCAIREEVDIRELGTFWLPWRRLGTARPDGAAVAKMATDYNRIRKERVANLGAIY